MLADFKAYTIKLFVIIVSNKGLIYLIPSTSSYLEIKLLLSLSNFENNF